jgi:hypothetical protein
MSYAQAQSYNPYAHPVAEVPHGARPTDYFEEDGCLVVRDGSVLPPICVATGEPMQGPLQTKTVRQIPTWTVWIFLLVSRLIGLVLMLAMQQTFRVTMGISPAAKVKRTRGLLVGVGVVVAAIAVLSTAIVLKSTVLMFVGFIAFWVGVFMAFLLGRPYKVKKSAGEYVYLELHAEALYEFEKLKQQHAPVLAAPGAPAWNSPNSPF